MTKIEMGSQEDGEECDAVVCIPVTNPLTFPDNLTGECAECGIPIQFRPHAPKTPPKICMICVMKDGEDHSIMITPKTAVEVAEFIRKKNAN